MDENQKTEIYNLEKPSCSSFKSVETIFNCWSGKPAYSTLSELTQVGHYFYVIFCRHCET